MSEQVEAERFLQTDLQVVAIQPTIGAERILDIGGGGEGIIGKVYGARVVAIDKRKDELEETENEALKIVMDGTDLSFLDESFHAVTLFYTLMYMPPQVQESVLKEVYRVLHPGGKVYVWDVNIPAVQDDGKDIFVAQLEVQLPSEIIRTGYGVQMIKTEENVGTVSARLKKAGFQRVQTENVNDQSYFILAQKG